jgi:hypothetical protein
MSDIPEGYYVNGKELLGFRREPLVIFPGEPVKNKKKKKKGPNYQVRFFLLARDGNKCHYCKNKMIEKFKQHEPLSMSIEHIVPRSVGGSNEPINLVLACSKCNNELGDKYIKCRCLVCMKARYKYESSI